MARTTWRSSPTPAARWKGRSPSLLRIVLVFAIPLALLATAVYIDAQLFWTPLQRLYFATYLNGSPPTGMYLLKVRYDKHARYATERDVIPLHAAAGQIPFTLSESARVAGARSLAWERVRGEEIYFWFRDNIYRGRTPWQMIERSFWALALTASTIAVLVFRRRLCERRQIREGRVLQGPELVSRAEFNRKKRSDGIGFEVRDSATLLKAMTGRKHQPLRIQIPRKEECQHILLMGDTGTGKSSLIRRLLSQIEDRGECAVVYDPALEYTPHFCRPERGDHILNPLDARMPYWTPGDEVTHAAEALTLAKSLFPDKLNDSRFFVESARKVFAHLLRYRPSPQDLSAWMKNAEEIDRRLAGTELAALVDPRAPGQRSGVLASLNLVADAFELLPEEFDCKARWSASAWSRQPAGWLFLPSTHEVRDRLLPVVSMWLDSLILRLISRTGHEATPVWIILDELASLQKLPQLATALAEGRKANVRLVLGFQGRSQLEQRYGPEAETMLSQPMTKVFLRTSEPRAAEWISKAIGEVEVERLRDSHTQQKPALLSMPWQSRDSESVQLERKTEPLVMASVIGGLPDLTGYIKSQNLVSQAQFPYVEAKRRIVGFLPRHMPDCMSALTAVSEPPGTAEEAHSVTETADLHIPSPS